MIDLAPAQLELVQRLLRELVPQCEVRAFGSRVVGTAKPYSDLDLAVVGTSELAADRIDALREAFQNSDLPIRVDVLDWWLVSERFRGVIARGFEVVQTGAGPLSRSSRHIQTWPLRWYFSRPMTLGQVLLMLGT